MLTSQLVCNVIYFPFCPPFVVMNDIVGTMFSKAFMDELLKPQQLYSHRTMKTVLTRLAHASIMRLNSASMDRVCTRVSFLFSIPCKDKMNQCCFISSIGIKSRSKMQLLCSQQVLDCVGKCTVSNHDASFDGGQRRSCLLFIPL